MSTHTSMGNVTPLAELPTLGHLSQRRFRMPKFGFNGSTRVAAKVLDEGFQVKIGTHSITQRYPKTIWQRFPKTHRKILAQNLTFAATFQIPYLYPTVRRMSFRMPVPLAESFFFKGLALALPSTAIMQTHKNERLTSNFLRRLFEIDYTFSNQKTDIPPYNRTSFSDSAVMPFTFGKDSLLTFALARELGLTVYPVYIAEPYYPYEEFAKKLLSDSFRKEWKTSIGILRNSLGVLRQPFGWIGWELQLTQYSLMLLPYVYARRSGYILFSNEQSCNDTMIDDDGFRYNPVFEQSHDWLLSNSLMASVIGGNSLSVGTLLEPIHEIAIIKILHKRYPEIGKYQSSCDLQEAPRSGGRWCEDCSKCGRMYMFLLANGIDPRRVGFRHNLLRQKYHRIYSLFSSENRIMAFGYDQSEAGRNELILAFLLAYKRGHRGPVMQTFVRRHLQYAKKKERALRQTFFGIHSTKTIPADIRSRVVRIFRHELARLR